MVELAGDVGRVETKAGAQAALDTLNVAEGPEDVSRLARLAAAKGTKTRAIVKLLGRAAILLTTTAFDIAVLAGLGGVHGVRFCRVVQSRRRTGDLALRPLAQDSPDAASTFTAAAVAGLRRTGGSCPLVAGQTVAQEFGHRHRETQERSQLIGRDRNQDRTKHRCERADQDRAVHHLVVAVDQLRQKQTEDQ